MLKYEFAGARLLVDDFGKCFDFYSDILGMQVNWGDRNGPFASFGKEGEANFQIFAKNQMTAYEGYVLPASSGLADRSVYCIGSDDIDSDYEELMSRGVNFIGRPQTITEWYMRCVYFRDPEGNLFEINQGL